MTGQEGKQFSSLMYLDGWTLQLQTVWFFKYIAPIIPYDFKEIYGLPAPLSVRLWKIKYFT